MSYVGHLMGVGDTSRLRHPRKSASQFKTHNTFKVCSSSRCIEKMFAFPTVIIVEASFDS
jgi:hypothetical protein